MKKTTYFPNYELHTNTNIMLQPNVSAEWLAHLPHIHEVSVSNLGLETYYSGISWLSSVLQKCSYSTLTDWFIMMGWDYVSELRPPTGQIVHFPGDMWAWRAMAIMMSAEDNFWLVHQSSLAVLPADTRGAIRRNGRRSENLPISIWNASRDLFTRYKILRHGTSGFSSHPKEDVLRIFIALRNPSPRPALNPRTLGPVASTLITTPPRRPYSTLIRTRLLTSTSFIIHYSLITISFNTMQSEPLTV
jgi:hypothetical protein